MTIQFRVNGVEAVSARTETAFAKAVMSSDKSLWLRPRKPVGVRYAGSGRFVAVDPKTREAIELCVTAPAPSEWHELVPQIRTPAA